MIPEFVQDLKGGFASGRQETITHGVAQHVSTAENEFDLTVKKSPVNLGAL